MPATNLIVTGDPGVGKSTILLDFLAKAKQYSGKRVLFISGEMNQIDMYGYCKRYNQFAFIDTIFMCDYAEYDPKIVIEKSLEKGYDLVLIDSWAEVIEQVKDFHKWNAGRAEQWLLNLLTKHNMENYTCFLIIQQVTKGGVFVGSNRLKHMTTGMMHIKFDRDSGYRYMEFSKNRRGTVGEKIGFVLSNNNISYTPFIHILTEDNQ
jgi:DNA repair protein RadA/Sms